MSLAIKKSIFLIYVKFMNFEVANYEFEIKLQNLKWHRILSKLFLLICVVLFCISMDLLESLIINLKSTYKFKNFSINFKIISIYVKFNKNLFICFEINVRFIFIICLYIYVVGKWLRK